MYTMASMTKQINKLVKKFYKLAEDSGLTFIIINSSYTDVNSGGMFSQPKQIIRGGKSLALGKSASIKITKSYSKDNKVMQKINGEDVMVEHVVKYEAVKNKIGQPMKKSMTFLNTDPSSPGTFNYSKDVLTYASQFGFIKKGGAWFTAIDANGNELMKCQGADKMANYVSLNPSFYIKLKLLVYSKIYAPYEFYFHFNTLRNMLYSEFTAIQDDLRLQLRFAENIPEENIELFEELIEQKTDIPNLLISDVLSDVNLKKSEYELIKFYGEIKVNEIKKINESPVIINSGYDNIVSLVVEEEYDPETGEIIE